MVGGMEGGRKEGSGVLVWSGLLRLKSVFRTCTHVSVC